MDPSTFERDVVPKLKFYNMVWIPGENFDFSEQALVMLCRENKCLVPQRRPQNVEKRWCFCWWSQLDEQIDEYFRRTGGRVSRADIIEILMSNPAKAEAFSRICPLQSLHYRESMIRSSDFPSRICRACFGVYYRLTPDQIDGIFQQRQQLALSPSRSGRPLKITCSRCKNMYFHTNGMPYELLMPDDDDDELRRDYSSPASRFNLSIDSPWRRKRPQLLSMASPVIKARKLPFGAGTTSLETIADEPKNNNDSTMENFM